MHIHVKNRIKNTDNPFRSSDLGVMSPQSEMGCRFILTENSQRIISGFELGIFFFSSLLTIRIADYQLGYELPL